MQEQLNRLKTILAEVFDLHCVGSLLGWDQQTNMPPGGANDRGNQLALIDSLAHERFTSPEVGRLLDSLEHYAAQLDPDSDDACLVRFTAHEYRKLTRVPTELVAEFAQVTTLAHQAWESARRENDFASFIPHLEKVFDLRRRYADLFAPYDHIYDPLLDDFDPGMKTADAQAIFEALRPQQVGLLRAIAARPQVDDSFVYQPYDGQKQWDFGVDVITRFGYDWKRGRQDQSAHPFSTSFGLGDARITTRILPEHLTSAMFSSMHEAGHAMYEQGIDPKLARSPMAHGQSSVIHESQSRLWENLVGRSLPFWEFYYPRLQALFPEQLKEIGLETFYKAINKVEPSLIRVEADEATYNLHIMLRLELEIALVEGSLEMVDLPQAWNSRVQEYLGIEVPDDARGVLQDVHWSNGLIGYFPTYALGNLVSAQLWKCIRADIPDLDDQIRQGEFGALLAWLRGKIHRHASKYESQDLVQRVTGENINPAAYMQYMQEKYAAIYEIE